MDLILWSVFLSSWRVLGELGGVFGLSPRGARALKLHRDPFSSVNIIISSIKENYENKNLLKMPRKKKEDKDVNSEEKVTI